MRKNNYIFLDFEGVMTTFNHKKVDNASDFPIQLNASAVDAINKIVIATEATIVVTSTHRRTHSIGQIRRMFIAQGVVDCIKSATDTAICREVEITESLMMKDTLNMSYLILDDNILEGFGDHFHLVDGGSLSDKDVERCIEILNIEDGSVGFNIPNPPQEERGLQYNPSMFEHRKVKSCSGKFGDEGYDYVPSQPIEPTVNEGPKIKRNDPCPCGSGKKYKKCCISVQLNNEN